MKPELLNKSLSVLLGLAALTVIDVSVFALPSDRQQEAIISANKRGEINQKTGVRLLEGNVKVVQGTLEINADTLKMEVADNSYVYTAEGSPATFQQQPEVGADLVVGRSNRIVYEENSGKVIFIGDAHVNRGGATTKAQRLEYDSVEGSVVMQGPIEMVIPPKPTDTDTN